MLPHLFFLYFVCILGNTDAFTILPLCREYQVDWLTKNIQEFLQRNFTKVTTTLSSRLKYLKLAEDYQFEVFKENLLTAETFNMLFMDVRMMSEFNELHTDMKVRIARNFFANKCKPFLQSIKAFDTLLAKLLEKD